MGSVIEAVMGSVMGLVVVSNMGSVTYSHHCFNNWVKILKWHWHKGHLKSNICKCVYSNINAIYDGWGWFIKSSFGISYILLPSLSSLCCRMISETMLDLAAYLRRFYCSWLTNTPFVIQLLSVGLLKMTKTKNTNKILMADFAGLICIRDLKSPKKVLF